MNDGEGRIEEALRAVGDDYVRRNPPDLLRARNRIDQLRRRRQMKATAGAAFATAAVVAVAVLAWPGAQTAREAPRPAAEIELPAGWVSVSVGDEPTEVAVGDGALWVSNAGDGTVSRIDPVSNEVVTVPLSGAPGDLAVGEGGEVWAASPELGAVQRIDPVTSSPTPDRRIDVAPADTPLDLAIDGFLWVSVIDRDLVQVDPATGDEVRRIDWVRPVNVAAREGAVFVLDAGGTVYGVDRLTGEPTGFEISFDVEDRGDVHYDDGHVWVAEGDGSAVHALDFAGASRRIRSYGFRGTYVEMVHTPAGVVVLSDLGDGSGVLTQIDAATGETTELGEIEGGPRDLVQGSGAYWVSTSDADAVVRIPSLP
ncbi:MAG TPA: hypothetical protein VEV43_02730 [Actinomycetota bacterium]|nr:hypothetical protein [Actinomycetota bacterium]